MIPVLMSFLLSFGLTLVAIPVIIRIAQEKKLYDLPDFRKIHTNLITSLGGLGIFGGFIIALMLTLPFSTAAEFQYYIAASLILFFLGLKDDILIISPIKKLVGQLAASCLIINFANLEIDNLYGFLGIYQLHGSMSMVISYLTVLTIINGFNLIDGIDGLAGSLGVMVTSLLGLYFFKINFDVYAIFSFALAGSLIAFLIFNFQPAKIFMGDTGSLLIGLVCSILIIKFINVASTNAAFPVNASPAVGFSIILIPVLDTLRVFSIRIINGRSPFTPDNNHIHHIFFKLGVSHRAITMILVATNSLFIAIAYYLRSLGCTLLMFLLPALFYSALLLLGYIRSNEAAYTVQTKDSSGKDVNNYIKDPVLVE